MKNGDVLRYHFNSNDYLRYYRNELTDGSIVVALCAFKDAHRTPITLANDWEEYVRSHVIDYDFEVWELQDGRFVCIKEWW